MRNRKEEGKKPAKPRDSSKCWYALIMMEHNGCCPQYAVCGVINSFSPGARPLTRAKSCGHTHAAGAGEKGSSSSSAFFFTDFYQHHINTPSRLRALTNQPAATPFGIPFGPCGRFQSFLLFLFCGIGVFSSQRRGLLSFPRITEFGRANLPSSSAGQRIRNTSVKRANSMFQSMRLCNLTSQSYWHTMCRQVQADP